MLAIFMTFQRMEADRELLILKTSGVSIYQLLPAPFIFLILIMAIHIVISFYLMPMGLKKFQNTILDMAKTKTKLSIKPGFFNTEIPNMTIYVQNLDRKRDLLKNILIERKDKSQKSLTVVIAPFGKIETDYKNGRIIFSLNQGVIYNLDFITWNIIEFGRYIIALDLSSILRKIDIRKDKAELFSWSEINYVLDHPEKYSERFYKKMLVEKYKRISLPFACVVLGFFAMSLAWIFYGIKRYVGVLLMIFMFFIYYSVFSFSLNLGKLGYVNPFLSAWLSNFLFLTITFGLFYFSQKTR